MDSVLLDNSGGKPEMATSETEDEMGRSGQAQNTSTPGSARQNALIGIAVLLGLGLCAVTGVFFSSMNEKQSLSAELQAMTERTFTAESNAKRLDMVNSELWHLLNTTQHNFTLSLSGNVQLQQLLNATQHDFLLALSENVQLQQLLNETRDYCTVLSDERAMLSLENRRLKLNLNQSLHNNTVTSAESERLRQLLHEERATAKRQHSILMSDRVSFLWEQCDKTTLRCSRCLAGWTEHGSRCFILPRQIEKWEDSRRVCLSMGGDLAIVLNAADQAFLTNMTYEFLKHNPQENFHSAWIGLQDMVKEGTFLWVNGEGIKYPVIYWLPNEPNNAMADWDKSGAGQDCVAIVPPPSVGQKGWLDSWDDIICGGQRHFICESPALILT